MSHVLVLYASKHGATEEIARAIAGELRKAGHSADCVSADEATDIGSYDAAVVGSAVYMGRWRPAARRLLRRFAKQLGARPLWMFSSGPCGQPDPKFAAPPGIERRARKLKAREHVVFGGRTPEEPSNFIERSMLAKTAPEHRDLRNWDLIRDWAAGIGSGLTER